MKRILKEATSVPSTGKVSLPVDTTGKNIDPVHYYQHGLKLAKDSLKVPQGRKYLNAGIVPGAKMDDQLIHDFWEGRMEGTSTRAVR
jgi:hypothetical protein